MTAAEPPPNAEPPEHGPGLDALEARLAEDLARLDLPKKPWLTMPPASRPAAGGGDEGRAGAGTGAGTGTGAGAQEGDGDGDTAVVPVVIVGAGMAGLTLAAALGFAGVPAVLYDRSPAGFEGPWATTARMETLRSPKTLAGPALGLPSLTFRAWYEARFGGAAWADLGLIPRLQWMDYLRWYRRVLGLDVRNGHAVGRIEPTPAFVRLAIDGPDGAFEVRAARVVIATGRDGLGGPWLPPWAEQIPARLRAHSSDEIDFDSLRGRRVGVIGAGASAMDVAATALEAGARSVDLLFRRPDLPRVNKGKGAGNPGFVAGFHDLPDAWKWRIRHYIATSQVPPPRGSTLRVARHPEARFHPGASVRRVDLDGKAPIELDTTIGRFELDFLLLSTGFTIDWNLRPEFAAFADDVLVWRDRFVPPAGESNDEMLDSPYLGAGLEFLEREPGARPGLDRIHCFCYPAAMSHGTVSGDIPAISDGASRLADALLGRLYRETVDARFAALEAYAEPELDGSEWEAAPPPSQLPQIPGETP